MKKYGILIRLTAVILLSACLCVPVLAAASQPVAPRSSDYLTILGSDVCAKGGGKLQIWFTAAATNYMDELGSTRIYLYESTDNVTFTRIATFLADDYPNMISYNDSFHSSYVSYQGTAGRYYKAYACIWAGKNGGGDARYTWSNSEYAT